MKSFNVLIACRSAVRSEPIEMRFQHVNLKTHVRADVLKCSQEVAGDHLVVWRPVITQKVVVQILVGLLRRFVLRAEQLKKRVIVEQLAKLHTIW